MTIQPDFAVQVLPPESESERRQRWLQHRRKLITGTDISAILGLSKFRSAIDVWQDKRGESTDLPSNPVQARGKQLEGTILGFYSDVLGVPLVRADPYECIQVPDFPLLGASLDARWLDGDRKPVDAKNILHPDRGEWGVEGSDDFPDAYRLQLAVQMMATRTPLADLAVFFREREFVAYRLHHDPEVDSFIREQVTAWWERHIVHGVQPEPDASKSYAQYLTRRFSRHSERTITADPFITEWATRLALAREARDDYDREVMLCENTIKAALGDAQAVQGGAFTCTFRSNKDSTVTNYQAALESLRERGLVSDAHFREVIAEQTTTTPGARVFRFNPKGLLTSGSNEA